MIKITFCSLSFLSTLISLILVSFWFILPYSGVVVIIILPVFRLFLQQSQQNIWNRQQLQELYPGWDTFEFDQGHLTKNQPITVPVLLSESLGI